MSNSLNATQKAQLKQRIRSISEPKEPLKAGVSKKLKPLDNIRVVLFDVYGTILISGTEPMETKQEQQQLDDFKKTLTEFEISYKEEAPEKGIKLLHKVIGEVHQQKKETGIDYPEVDIISVWKTVLSVLKAEDLISDFPDRKVPDIITDFVTRYDQPWLMPGLQNVMDQLSEKELEIGIISNSQFYTPLTLEALSEKNLREIGFNTELLFWSFAEDIAKPSVQFYEIAKDKLMNTFSVKPAQVLVVGNDMLNDVYPAQKAGFKTALFAGDRRSLRLREDDERCQNIQPDIQITHLSQILDCLDSS